MVSEETVTKAADVTRGWINNVLLIACDIAIGGNLKLFVQVCFIVLVMLFAYFKSNW